MADEVLLITLPYEPFPESFARLKKLQPCIKEIIYFNLEGPQGHETVPADVWARATIYLTLRLFPKSREQVHNLKWIHTYSAGINQALNCPLFHDPNIHWTRNSGVHAPQIAEWAISMLLAHYRQIPLLLGWQAEQSWRGSEFRAHSDLLGKTIAFYGYGAIARHAARIASACGMRVVAYTLHEKATPEQRVGTTFTPANTGDPEGKLPAKWYHGDLDDFLSSESIDVLVVALPSTEKTRKSIAASQMAKLRGCYIINVGRGDIIHTDDLVAALNDGTLFGAALDVTDPEPLPKGHPLWTARNTLISPHISGLSDEYMPRTIDILSENLSRLSSGKPLINQVSRKDGY